MDVCVQETGDVSLRFVLLTNSESIPAWQVRCLQHAISWGGAKLVGVVENCPAAENQKPGLFVRLQKNRKKLLWRLFNRLYLDRQCQATRVQSIRSLTESVPWIYDEPIPVGKHSERLTDAAIEFIHSVRPDFILRFGFGILKGSVLTASPLGVWSYHHGDPAHFRGQPPGFWEIFEGKTTTGTVLQVLGEQLDGGRILERGSFRTISHSYAKTRDAIYFGASSWVAKVCRQLRSCGVEGPIGHKQEMLGRVYREPENKDVIVFLFRTFVSFVAMVANYKLRWPVWNVGIIDAPIEEVAGLLGAERKEAALTRVKWLPESRDRFRADPFGFRIGEPQQIRILYESFEWRKDRGDIRSVVFDGETFKDEVLALDAPTHLSYPFVISWEGKRYFIPEHSEARNVSAFELADDGRAVAKRTIFSHSEMVDATVIQWDGRVWIFAIVDDEATNAELNIFYSESLWGPWRAHVQNPVKTDVSSSRPAGTPFEYEGTLYRPSQDCGPHYGSGIRINKIERLTPTEFIEHEVTRLAPAPRMRYGHGLHTISSAGAYTLIDASKLKFRFPFRPLPFRPLPVSPAIGRGSDAFPAGAIS